MVLTLGRAAARPGRNAGRVTPATLAHRLGTLRIFFVRIHDRHWPDAPARVPLIPADLPRQNHPLPDARSGEGRAGGR